MLAKVALNDGVNAVALAMAREACAAVLMFIIARRYTCGRLRSHVPGTYMHMIHPPRCGSSSQVSCVYGMFDWNDSAMTQQSFAVPGLRCFSLLLQRCR